MEIQVIEKTNGRINRVTGTTIKERLRVCAYARVSTYNEEQAEIIKYIFERYVEGIGSSTIAKELKAKGIKSPKGNDNWN